MEAEISISTSSGKYEWCGNMYENPGSGYYLSKIDTNLTANNVYSCMINMEIEMSLELYDAIDRIELHDSTGFLAYYNTEKIDYPIHKIFIPLKYTTPGTILEVRFKKILPRPEATRHMIGRPPPMQIIHQQEIEIPQLRFLNNECPICIEPIIENETPLHSRSDLYISKCQHAFHYDCFVNYINSKFAIPVHEMCILFKCKHNPKTNPIPCPICRTLLENNN